MRPGSCLLLTLCLFAFAPTAEADDFTVVIFGDTQTYSDTSALEPVFENMIDYVIANAVSDNIALVLQVGDAIEQGTADAVTADTTEEWGRFNAQWKRLDGVLPYAVARGNHDNTQEFSLHYGSTPSSAFPHYLETHQGEDDDANAWVVDLGGQDAVVLGISCNPSAAELGWAQGVLDSNPALPAIVLSHIITTSVGFHTVSASFAGEAACNGNPLVSVWDELVTPNAAQVFMTASGHFVPPSHGFKGMRETEGAIVLDTFQNWQGGASANGCMTLVRFRPAVREVEVEAFCTELNAGAGAFLNAPGETTLPTVTVDGCLDFGLFDAFGPGVCPPLPVPIPPSSPGTPTISFNDDALVPNSLLFRAITVSAGSLLNLSTFEVLDATEIAGALLLESDEVFDPGVEDMNAAHAFADGSVVFSTITDVFIEGVRFRPGDLVHYDPLTGLSTKFFDMELFSQVENIDAVYVFEEGEHEGKLLLSTTAIAELGGLIFNPGDLVLYDPVLDTSTLFFSESLMTGTAAQKNIDAIHVLPNGNLLLSVLIDNGTLGGLVLKEEDIVEYDPGADVATVFLALAGLFNGTTADTNALTFAPRVPVLAPSLSPPGWALLVLALALPSLLMLRRGRRGVC